jgi:hypothetical protein
MVDPKLIARVASALIDARLRQWEAIYRSGGGRKPGATLERDIKMAREFQRRKPSAGMSDTALKIDIGRKQRPQLKKSASIEAINRGLKKLSG